MQHHAYEMRPDLQPKVLALAISLIFSAAYADDEVERLTKPESSFTLGAGHVSGDSQRFGVYNGLGQEGSYGIGEFSLVRRDDETGTWLRASGRNLGLSTREMRVEHERQGQWGYFVDFSQIPRVAPYDVYTNVAGLKTDTQTVPRDAAIGADNKYDFRTERQMTKLGLNRTFLPGLELRVLLQNEEKDGRRLFGRGTGGFQEFLAEPINSTTRQVDVVLDYTGEKLQLSGGYYGSFYNNHNSVLNAEMGNIAFTGNLNGAGGVGRNGVAYDNIALPPDNSAHQFHLAGAYQFTKTTRASFKVAKTRAIQNDDFMAVNFFNASNNGADANTSGRSNLGGRVDTSLVQLGLTSRPLPKLSLLANLRYEDRDDRTTVARYITNVSNSDAAGTTHDFNPLNPTDNPTVSTTGYNEPRSLTVKSGKFEASYQLPEGFRVTGGLDVEEKERSVAGVRIVGYRDKTHEDTYRVELKRAMAETLTGSMAYLHSERTGSSYINLVTLSGSNYPTYGNNTLACGAPLPSGALAVTRCGLVQPIFMADRQRDKVRLALDWAPLDALSAQFMVEDAKDDYGRGRGDPDIGARKGDARLYSVDVTYVLTDNWKLSSWASRTETGMDQATLATPSNNTTLTLWSSSLKNTVDSYAVGVRGKLLGARLDVGADYILAHDHTVYGTQLDNAGTAAVSAVPDITWRQTTLKLFGRYGISKDLAMRMDYVFNQYRTNDWTWTNWTYSDGTRISQAPLDKVHFIGVSAIYSFR